MSFTDGKPWTVTTEDVKRPWSGGKNGKYFRCKLCGHRFVAGDTCRFVFANFADAPTTGGNFFVCLDCDGPDVLNRMGEAWRESKERFWWLWSLLESEREASR